MDVVQEIRSDTERGAQRLEREYRSRLMAVAERVCGDRGLSEDLVNETFSVALERIETLADPSALFSWMCGILVNSHSHATRRKEHERIEYTADLPETPDDGAERVFEEIDAGILRDAIEKLPQNMKEALLLHYFMEMPLKKVARILSVPTGTVMSRLYYARVLLGRRLGAKVKRRAVSVAVCAVCLSACIAALLRSGGPGASGDPGPSVASGGVLRIDRGTHVLSQRGSGRIWVGKGATLDLDGNNVSDCEVTLAGGTITSARPAANVTLPQRMTLTADSRIVFANVEGNHDMGVPKDAVWNLGGHTLDVVMDGFDPDLCMEEGETISNGTFRVAVNATAHGGTGRGWVQFANLNGRDGLNLDLGNSILRLKHHAPNINSTVCGFTCRPPQGETVYSGNQLEVYGVYKPQSTDGFNITMMDGSTLDLSDRDAAWNCKFSNSGGYATGSSTGCKVSFAAGATVNVNLAGRADLKSLADAGGHIILWAENAVPDVDLMAIVDELAGNDYSLASDKSGAWVRRMGGLVIIVNFDSLKGRRRS